MYFGRWRFCTPRHYAVLRVFLNTNIRLYCTRETTSSSRLSVRGERGELFSQTMFCQRLDKYKPREGGAGDTVERWIIIFIYLFDVVFRFFYFCLSVVLARGYLDQKKKNTIISAYKHLYVNRCHGVNFTYAFTAAGRDWPTVDQITDANIISAYAPSPPPLHEKTKTNGWRTINRSAHTTLRRT